MKRKGMETIFVWICMDFYDFVWSTCMNDYDFVWKLFVYGLLRISMDFLTFVWISVCSISRV